MDSRTRIDYALFQLTPTRTRCDLVIFSGNAKEKLASGLLEPFLSHLNSAKDQISKGGYSITLRPATDAAWFTKSTLERFVRFVSTPEVLERFVTIETEISQIESSVQSAGQINATTETETGNVLAADGNTKNSAVSPKLKGESGGPNDAVHEEHSKVHLQRILETRKAVLRKEQAMAYARALVAGFEMDYIDDLISFADAFGASRLREACINFMELCNKKNNDGLWMDEIAAMQAFSHPELSYLGTSGIILAGEDNDPTRELMINVQNGGLSGGQQNGSIDASASDSTLSHGSLEANQDNSLPASTQTRSIDGKAQMPMPWASHLPPYMQNFQGPMFQQMPPYQGYLYPGMQAPPYYSGNMPWRPNVEDSRLGPDAGPYDGWSHKSKSKKEKFSQGKGLKQDGNTDPSDSSSASDSDEYEEHGKRNISIEKQHTKKNGKRSSRKVVIRNINYITSKAEGETEGTSSDEDGFIDGDSLKQQVEEAVGSLDRRHKSSSRSNKKRGGSKHGNIVNGSNGAADQDFENVVANNYEGAKRTESWDIFQNLLLRDADSTSNDMVSQSLQVGEGKPSAFDVESEQVKEHRNVSTDSFVVTQRVAGNEDKIHKEHFEAGETVRPLIKRENRYEELLFPQRNESENSLRGVLSNYTTEAPIIKSQTEGDWFISNQPNKLANQDDYATPFIEDHFQSSKTNKDVLDDDSFMIQSRPLDNSSSQPRTDIFMVSDIVGATQLQRGTSDNLQEKVEATRVCEPDDLYMVLGRDAAAEQAVAPWNPEMDYGDSNQLTEATKRHSDVEPADCVDAKLPSQANGAPEGKASSKAARPKGSVGSVQKSKSDVISRSKKPSQSKTMTPKSKSHQEEEKRKKMEELLIQRQKRIAERSAASGVTPVISRSKSLRESKTATASTKNEKPKVQAPTHDTKNLNKPILRSSTLDRLSAARVTQNLSPIELKTSQPRKSSSKENGVAGLSLPKKTAGAELKKLNVNKVKPSDRKTAPKNSKTLPSKKDGTSATAALPIEIRTSQATEPAYGVDDSEDIKELHSVSPVTKNVDMNLKSDTLDDNSCNVNSYNEDLSVHTENHYSQMDHLKGAHKVIIEESPVLHEGKVVSNDRGGFHPLPTTPSKDLKSATLTFDEDDVAHKSFPVSPEFSVVELSTPPPTEMNPEPNQSRKKWNNGDNSPKAAKGLRKLLLFGRKSRNSP